jgi:CMP-N-acetylneuraminic acid synthetase
MSSVLALIPARAGSKRLAGKNLLPLAGKPLIAWTIDAAGNSRLVTRTVVSTEDERIAACAREHGAEVPVMRPASMAQDQSPGMDPILHMIEWLQRHENYRPDTVVVLQPTSPLRTADDIDAAIQLMNASGASSVVSVAPIGAPGSWLRVVAEDRRARPVMADGTDLHVLNGAIYAARTGIILSTRQMDDGAPVAYVMPRARSIDIDTREDFDLAESLLRGRR